MTHEEYQNSIMAIAERYGYEAQSRQLIEEMAELTVAINKHWRYCKFEQSNMNRYEKVHGDVVEEMADVLICIDQLIYIMQCEVELSEQKARKIERQLERMKSDEK